MLRIQVIHWRPAEAAPLLSAIQATGAQINMYQEPSGPAVAKAIRDMPPDAVVIDLSRLPSHGREVAIWLRNRRATRSIPIVFAGGDAAKVAPIRELLPDAVFTDTGSIASALRELPAHPNEPVAMPAPMMRRYANRTAAEKMGIRTGTKVGVIDAPRDYVTVLGQIPEAAELLEDPDDVCPVTVWFTHEPDSFLAALPEMRRIAGVTKLWVLWRKGSKNGISQNFVRENGIDAGLVDYKICSVDGKWSGIAFARSKR
jgi:CheY-like chemotaxis protein